MPRTRKTFPSIVAALDAAERSLVLDELLAVHPELAEEGNEIARALLSSVTVEEVAEDLRSEIELLDITDLASSAGRQPGLGYVHETEAAYELAEEVFRPLSPTCSGAHNWDSPKLPGPWRSERSPGCTTAGGPRTGQCWRTQVTTRSSG